MSKLKGNYTMGDAMDYCRKGKVTVKILALFGTFFPFIPPYYLGFDPRFQEQIAPFYIYLGTYYVLFVAFLGKFSDKQDKTKKIVAEKAILMGCPIDIKPLGKGGNSYSSTVMVNEAMLALLRLQRLEDAVVWQEDDIALKEPFEEKFPITSATSAKFLEKLIPHYDKARKIGTVPPKV